MTKLILYACPVGELAIQIEQYFQESLKRYGNNAAHAYMPHCTLTGFFEKENSDPPHQKDTIISHYTQTLTSILAEHRPLLPTSSIIVEPLIYKDNWHGLPLRADGLKHLAACFAAQASLPTQTEAIRLKDWLHLSLAYDFEPEHAEGLKQLATQMIDSTMSVSWELRCYERDSKRDNTSPQRLTQESPLKDQWTCHCSLPL